MADLTNGNTGTTTKRNTRRKTTGGAKPRGARGRTDSMSAGADVAIPSASAGGTTRGVALPNFGELARHNAAAHAASDGTLAQMGGMSRKELIASYSNALPAGLS